MILLRKIITTYFQTKGEALARGGKLNMKYPNTTSFALGELALALANLCFAIAKVIK